MEWGVEGLMANGDYPWSSGGGSRRLGRMHALCLRDERSQSGTSFLGAEDNREGSKWG